MNALQWFRKIHLYLGMFTTPAILFFAFSGVLQTLNLNDASRDGSYKPPHWISVLAQVHKKQTAQLPPRRPPVAIAAPALDAQKKPATAPSSPDSRPGQNNPVPLKIFFVIVCANLLLSTISGVYLSWKYRRDRAIIAALLVAGAVIPLVLLKL